MSMFKFFLLLCFVLPLRLHGQTAGKIQPGLIVPLGPDSLALGEGLVALALENYPAFDALRYEIKQEDEEVSQARWNWLNDLSASFNLNEGNINPNATDLNSNLFFPRYNFRFSLSVGTFVNAPSKTRKAKLGRKIAAEALDEEQLSMRRELLSRYYNYLYNIHLLKLKLQAHQDVYSTFTSATESFTNGEISIDEYNKVLMAKNQEQENLLEIQRTLLLSKLALEELLGMPLEEAVAVAKRKE